MLNHIKGFIKSGTPRSKLAWLLILTWALCIVTSADKEGRPQFLDSAAIQWGALISVAVLIPIGSLWSLLWIHMGPPLRRWGFWYLAGFSLRVIYLLVALGMVQPVLMRIDLLLLPPGTEAQIASKATDQAIDSPDPEKRESSAAALYQMFGIRTVWQNRNGVLERYQPTAKDQDAWNQSVESNNNIVRSIDAVHRMVRRMPWIFGLYLGCYFVVMFTGLCIFTYKSKAGEGTQPIDRDQNVVAG